jgi:RNA polymerase sigma-70 factor (ECF subfamily)
MTVSQKTCEIGFANTTRSGITSPMPHGDQEAVLVTAAVGGDADALETIYRTHGGAVHSMARRLLRNEALADEVTQDVFVRLWQRGDRFDPGRGTLRAYLLRDTHGRAVDLLRAEQARRTREEKDAQRSSDVDPGPEQEVWATVRSESVRAALETLPEREREAIVLAYYKGLAYKQVAEVLGEPEGTIKSRIRLGLRRLQGPLAQQGLTEP